MRHILFLSALLGILGCGQHEGSDQNTSPTDSSGQKNPVTGDSTSSKPMQKADTVFKGFGNEPFWAVYVIKDKAIVFHPIEGGDQQVPYQIPVIVDSLTQRYESSNGTTHLLLVITKKDCSDMMSDITHKWAVDLTINKNKFAGCGKYQ